MAPGQFVGGPPDADVHPRLWWEWWRKQLNLNHYFAQGIEVWTDAGLRPIEQVLVGDRVLTRDPQSEELTLNLVIGIDARPQDSMRIIEVDSRTIVATPEQPFFVADEGWRDADKLEPGIELDGFAGPERIEKIESSTASSTYSLLIENVPNFFVDQQGILVHDATRR